MCGLSLAVPALVNGRPWVALLWLAMVGANLVLPFVSAFWVRSLGVYLTPEAAVIRGWRRRRVPWPQVQSVVSQVSPNGTSAVQLILENDDPVVLPFPKTLWRKGDAIYDRDFQSIDQWWLAHRGESWRNHRQDDDQG